MGRTGGITFDGERWSNADADRIRLSRPDHRWPAMFRDEARRIRGVLKGVPSPRIEHVGSTAIPDVAAKPVIDILLVLPEDAPWSRLIAPLESLEYVYWMENPRRDRMFFVKGMPPYGKRRTHHVHVRQPADAREMILFRDHLRRNPGVAKRYEALKRGSARRHPRDREAYTRAKGVFVRSVLSAERAEGAGSEGLPMRSAPT